MKWGILAALLSYTAAMGIWANRASRDHVCTGIEVEVEGEARRGEELRKGIDEELHRYPRRIVGTPIHELNTADIEAYLGRYRNFESVNCMVSGRGKLVVRVVPLIPVMRVFYGDRSYYINREGKHIVSNAEYFTDVPVVSGAFNRTFKPEAVLPLVNFIKNDDVLKGLVTMVEARDAGNLMLVPRIRGHVVNFGDTTRLEEKKRALLLFYRQVMPYKGWEEYDTVSVKFRGQVVATRRDKTRLNHAEHYEETEDLEEGTLPDGGSAPGIHKRDSVPTVTTRTGAGHSG